MWNSTWNTCHKMSLDSTLFDQKCMKDKPPSNNSSVKEVQLVLHMITYHW